jgi:G:T-mismatch repair DNA endonuclease (very short patch repair protein)
MNQKNKICPFCDKKFSAFKHLKTCNNNVSYSESLLIFLDNVTDNNSENIARDYESGLSLHDIRKKYKSRVSTTLRILNLFGIRTRSVKESNTDAVVTKRKKTCIELFGVENPSQAAEIKVKKRNTTLKNYGVDNIFKIDGFGDMVSEIMFQKYGVNRISNGEKISKIRSLFSLEKWKEFDIKRKRTCNIKYGVDDPSQLQWRRKLTGMIFKEWRENASDLELQEVYANNDWIISKLERKVWDILSENNILFQPQRFINKRSYDISILGTMLIIEVQGDYWHANPAQYKETDLIDYPNRLQLTAGQVWQRDLIKKENAESYGFKILYLWETDIDFHQKNQTLDLFVLNSLYEAGTNQND